MLASITPLGERGRGRRWELSAPAYVVGSALGGLVVGAVAGSVGLLLRPLTSVGVVVVALAAGAVVAVLLDLRIGGRRVPGPRRQVNEDWLDHYREWVYGGGFGAQLGAGVLTQVPTAAVWLMLLACLLTGSPLLGAFVGLLFGTVRALPVLGTRGVRDPGTLRGLHRTAARWEGRAHRTNLAVLVLTAATLIVLAVLDVVSRSAPA